jgi:hypothetical protein
MMAISNIEKAANVRQSNAYDNRSDKFHPYQPNQKLAVYKCIYLRLSG